MPCRYVCGWGACTLLVLLWNAGAAGQEEEPAAATAQHSPVAFFPEYDGLGIPSHPDAVAWLKQYHATRYGSWGADWNATETSRLPDLVPCGSVRRRGPFWRPLHRKNKYLVLSAVGDRWKPQPWIQGRSMEYDVAVIYTGNDTSFTCGKCSHTIPMRGLKWGLLRNLTASPAWAAMAAQYKYVWLADDDLRMGPCSLNAFFRVMEQNALLMAQPSLCMRDGPEQVSAWKKVTMQRRGRLLHYTNFVECMGPAFDMGFFNAVVKHSIYQNNYALLKYPKKGIAIVDAACMSHLPRTLPEQQQTSIYSVAADVPEPMAEFVATMSAFNLTPEYQARHGGGELAVYSEVLLDGSASTKRRLEQLARMEPGTGGGGAPGWAPGARRRPRLSLMGAAGLGFAAGVLVAALHFAGAAWRGAQRGAGSCGGQLHGRAGKVPRLKLPLLGRQASPEGVLQLRSSRATSPLAASY